MPSLPAKLVAFGVALLFVTAVPVGGQSSDADYLHRVEPASNGTLEHGFEYEESDVIAYEKLSERGRTAFDRARSNGTYVAENASATASDFEYATDHVALGVGVYPIRYSGDVYSLSTERRTPGFNPLRWMLSISADALRPVGVALVVVGGLLEGRRRYGRRDE